MKVLGMDICLCRRVFVNTASQRGFPLRFYSAAYIATKEHEIMYKNIGMYKAFQKSFDSRHAYLIISTKNDVYLLASYHLKL